jgi:23S rRNA pseudouridine1911/1915/1917 synthase
MNAPSSPALREFVVTPADARTRLDRFVTQRAPEFSRVRIQRFIREELVLLNGKTARTREMVREGDRVQLIAPMAAIPPPRTGPVTTPQALSILFEDEDLMVLDKPAGISVHPGAGVTSGTLVDSLLAHCTNLSSVGGESRPGIVHRLDKQTSGCLVVAKNDRAHRDLSRQFAARTMEKIYLALVAGRLRQNAGTVNAAIARHRVQRTKMAVAREGGRAARTDFRVLRCGTNASLIECRLHSGRTHQIRVHLQHLGHPILGDTVYAGRRAGKFSRQMLHAWKLAFDHPRTKTRMSFEAPLPSDFKKAMSQVLPSLSGV